MVLEESGMAGTPSEQRVGMERVSFAWVGGYHRYGRPLRPSAKPADGWMEGIGMLANRAWIRRESGGYRQGAGCALQVPSRGLPLCLRGGRTRLAS